MAFGVLQVYLVIKDTDVGRGGEGLPSCFAIKLRS